MRRGRGAHSVERRRGGLVALGVSVLVAALLTGCAAPLAHKLAAPAVAGTVQVDVRRDGRWEALPESAFTLESPCSLRVQAAREGEIVRVRYASEAGVHCEAASSDGRVADLR